MNPQISISTTGGLTRIERARGFLEAAALSEQWVREMGRRAFLLEAHHTTHIEGTRLTLDQSRRLLEGSPVADADPEDVREKEPSDGMSSSRSEACPIVRPRR